MKKLIVILLTSIVLTGCYQTATIRDIENAANICGGLDQVAEISIAFDGSEKVTCANLKLYFINSDEIEKANKVNSK